MEIGTVYVAAPDGLTENCPVKAPLNAGPTGGPAILTGSGGTSPLRVTRVAPICTPKPVCPIGTGVRWGDDADAETGRPSSFQVIVWPLLKVGRKMPG